MKKGDLDRSVLIFWAVIVRFGRSVPEGFLPIYSVDSEEEAKGLLTAACQTNLDGEFVAKELTEEQNLDNLYAFGERLAKIHDRIKKIRAERDK